MLEFDSRSQKIKCFGCGSIIVVALLVVIAGILWAFWPSITGWKDVHAAIAAIEKFDLGEAIDSEQRYGVNTFRNEVSSGTIKKYYTRAAKALSDKSPNSATYKWVDQIGWARVSTVVQTDSGYIEVRASCNNDNDSVYIGFVPGRFDKPGASRLNGFELPLGILRCDWKVKESQVRPSHQAAGDIKNGDPLVYYSGPHSGYNEPTPVGLPESDWTIIEELPRGFRGEVMASGAFFQAGKYNEAVVRALGNKEAD